MQLTLCASASFTIPRRGPVFDDVIFLEMQPPHAEAIVAEMHAKVCGTQFHTR